MKCSMFSILLMHSPRLSPTKQPETAMMLVRLTLRQRFIRSDTRHIALLVNGGKTSSFVRKVEKTIDMPLDADVFQVPAGCNTPQQFNTKYYYVVGIGHTERKLWFITPEVGPDVPYSFGLIGDLGQSFDSNTTFTHYERNPRRGQTLLYVGDLSYADKYPYHDNNRWDTWGQCKYSWLVRICEKTHYLQGNNISTRKRDLILLKITIFNLRPYRREMTFSLSLIISNQ